MLRAFVELVSNVVSTFRMARRRQPVIGTRTMPALLPRTKSDPQNQDPNLAIPQDGPIALMVSSAAKAARPSNREQAVRAADELVQWSEERSRRDGLIQWIKPSDERRSDSEGSSGERLSASEGRALTGVSHTSPSPSSRALHAIHLPLLRMGRQAHSCDEGELPPSVRSTGGGGLRALARKTEGALCPALRPLISAPL